MKAHTASLGKKLRFSQKKSPLAGTSDSLLPSNVASVPASPANTVAKEGEHLFEHDGVWAVIQFAQHNGQWIAEFRFRFRCGAFQAATLPLTVNSGHHGSPANALQDAARRMVEAMAAATQGHELNKRQKKAAEAVTAWADQFKAAPITAPGKPAPQSKRFLDLFAGVGGFHLAMKQAGAECAGSVELDAPARQTYATNFPGDYATCDDIRKATAGMFGKVDIVCGGFPCQSFSQAGDGEGFEHEEKGALFFETARLIGDLAPETFILENVEALGTHDQGKTLDTILDVLTDLGYAVQTCVLNSGEFGLAQNRLRMFIVGIHDSVLTNRTTPFEFPRGTDASVVVADILGRAPAADQCNQSMVRQKANPKARSSRIEVVGLIDGKNCQGYRVASPNGKGFTLCANSGGPGSKTGLYLVSGKPRRLTARECARMQGFPESFIPHARPGIAKRQFGNSVAVPVVAAIARRLSKSIR
jgi:DNA (cytosine-5)-methyltransferase 1